MIKVIGKKRLRMHKGDTGAITFKLTGRESNPSDTYIFVIKRDLSDTSALFSEEFNEMEFTVEISESTSSLLNEGLYFWGLKLLREDEDNHLIDTLIGSGELIVEGCV